MGESCCKVIGVGDDVPDCAIATYEPATGDFGEVCLAEQKKQGKWTILVFYPADFTFVCATELDDLAQKYEEIKEAGADVVTVSCDTKYVHLAWRQHERELQNATYHMGEDPTGKLARLFGVYDEETGLSLRGTFIISPEGKLVASEVNFYNFGRNADELVRKLKACIYLAGHPDEACPAKWQDGDKTLTPSAQLVGHVYEALHGE